MKLTGHFALVSALVLSAVGCQKPSDQPNLIPARGGVVERPQVFTKDTPIDPTRDYESKNLKVTANPLNAVVSLDGVDAQLLYLSLQIRPYDVAGDNQTFSKGKNKDAYQMECKERTALGDNGAIEYSCRVGLDLSSGTVNGGWGSPTNFTHFYTPFNNPWDFAAGRPVKNVYQGMNLTIAPATDKQVYSASINLFNEDARVLYYGMKGVQEKQLSALALIKDSGAVRCIKEKKSNASSDVAFTCQLLIDYQNGNILNTQTAVNPAVAEM